MITDYANNSTRRFFLKHSATITVGALILPQIIPSTALGMGRKLPPGDTIIMGDIGKADQAAPVEATLVKYQKVFDDACRRAPAPFWAADGVHPTCSGHQLMADEWVRTVSKFFK